MDVLLTTGVLLGILVGIPTGMALQRMRLTRKTYTTAKNAMPTLKEAASKARTRGSLWILFLVAIIVLIVIVRVNSG